MVTSTTRPDPPLRRAISSNAHLSFAARAERWLSASPKRDAAAVARLLPHVGTCSNGDELLGGLRGLIASGASGSDVSVLFEVWNVDEPHTDREAQVVARVLAQARSFRAAVVRVRASTDLPASAATEAAAYVTKGRGRSAIASLLELAAAVEPMPSAWARNHTAEWTGTEWRIVEEWREKAELSWFTLSLVAAVPQAARPRLRRERIDRATTIEHGARMLALRGARRCAFATATRSGRVHRYCQADVDGRMLFCREHAAAHHDRASRAEHERPIRRAHEALSRALIELAE